MRCREPARIDAARISGSSVRASNGADFPEPDETTGRYCIEAVDRWRLQRHARLFPELTMMTGAVDAGRVFEQRIAPPWGGLKFRTIS